MLALIVESTIHIAADTLYGEMGYVGGSVKLPSLYNSEELKQFQKIVKKYGQTLYPPYYLN